MRTDFDIFGGNATHKLIIKRRFTNTIPPQITCASALYLTKQETQKSHFYSNAVLVHHQNSTSSLLDFFSLFDSRLILTLLYDSLNFVINAFSSGLAVGGMVQEKRITRTLQKLDCVARTMHQCAVVLVSYYAR